MVKLQRMTGAKDAMNTETSDKPVDADAELCTPIRRLLVQLAKCAGWKVFEAEATIPESTG